MTPPFVALANRVYGLSGLQFDRVAPIRSRRSSVNGNPTTAAPKYGMFVPKRKPRRSFFCRASSITLQLSNNSLTKTDTPQFRGGNPYFFRENPYQSVSFIYASMYSENVHAIHTIPYQFTKKIATLQQRTKIGALGHMARRDSRIRPTPLIDYRSIVIHGGRNLPFF